MNQLESRAVADQAFPDLTGLPGTMARELSAARRLMVYAPGEAVARVGERCDPGVVLEGLLRISIRSDDGRRATLRYIRKGQSFGVESLFQPMSHTVMAVTSSSVAHYDRLSTEQLMRRHPVLAVRIAHRLAESLKEMDEAAVGCLFMSVAQRVVHHLIAMAGPAGPGEVGT